MFKFIKRLLLSSVSLRQILYKNKYGVDKETIINNCYLSAKDFTKLKFNNCRLGDKGDQFKPIRIDLQHNSGANFGYKSFLREDVKIQLHGNSFFSLGEYSYLNWGTIVEGGGMQKLRLEKNVQYPGMLTL